MTNLTEKEIIWLKNFVRENINTEKEYEEEQKSTKKFRQDIRSGKLKNKKRRPSYVCKKCGKVKITSWGEACAFPDQNLRCHC